MPLMNEIHVNTISIPADPLPPEKVEGSSGDTDVFDDNDTPPVKGN